MDRLRRNAFSAVLGAGFCAGVAALLCAFTNDGWEFRLSAPIICLQSIILASLFWGRLSGLAGGILAGLTFAIWLFPPVGRLAVDNPMDRMMLLFFGLGALVIVLLSPTGTSRSGPLSSRADNLTWRMWDPRGRRDR